MFSGKPFSASPFSSLGGVEIAVSVGHAVLIEHLLSISDSDDTLAAEHLLGASSAEDLSIPLSWKLEIGLDGVFYIEWTKNISASEQQIILEHLGGVADLDTILLSYTGGIEIDQIIPLEWSGEFATGMKPLAWVLKNRGTLWTLNSRGELSWVLSSRGKEWVLPSKSTGWQINTRSNEWVL